MTSSLIRVALATTTVLAVLAPPAAAARTPFDPTPSPPHALVAGSGVISAGIPVTVEAVIFGSSNGPASGFYRTRSSFGGFEVAVQCLRVESGRAVAGGVITQSSAPGQIGTTSAFVLDNRSSSGEVPRDRIILGVAAPNTPPTAPCAISPTLIAGPFDTLVSGDFTINVLPF